jgi:hypothetical protein
MLPGKTQKDSPIHRLDPDLLEPIEKERVRRGKLAGVDLPRASVINALIRKQLEQEQKK